MSTPQGRHVAVRPRFVALSQRDLHRVAVAIAKRGWYHGLLSGESALPYQVHSAGRGCARQLPGAMRPGRCVSSKTTLQAFRSAAALFRQ